MKQQILIFDSQFPCVAAAMRRHDVRVIEIFFEPEETLRLTFSGSKDKLSALHGELTQEFGFQPVGEMIEIS